MIGWNGWLYPILFVVLPITAALMVLVLIICNLYEYYRKKRRLEQYQHYSTDFPVSLSTEPEKRLEIDRDMVKSINCYNDSQFTHSTIFANYTPNENNIAPVRPMSGWISTAPHM
jgi:hypothetical protein